MTEKDKIKALEEQAMNTKHLVDRINIAMYGMTWEEHERLHWNGGVKNAEGEARLSGESGTFE